jgi:hypothetical protein
VLNIGPVDASPGCIAHTGARQYAATPTHGRNGCYNGHSLIGDPRRPLNSNDCYHNRPDRSRTKSGLRPWRKTGFLGLARNSLYMASISEDRPEHNLMGSCHSARMLKPAEW